MKIAALKHTGSKTLPFALKEQQSKVMMTLINPEILCIADSEQGGLFFFDLSGDELQLVKWRPKIDSDTLSDLKKVITHSERNHLLKTLKQF